MVLLVRVTLKFMIIRGCTTDGFRAVNLSQDDIKEFLKAVLDHTFGR